MYYRILWCFTFCACLWFAGLCWFVAQIPTEPTNDTTPTDVIVVLTGGGGRLEYGLQLLAEHKGRVLFISGVSKGVSLQNILLKATPAVRNELASQPAGSIVLGHKAVNTIGNAEETTLWMKGQSYKSIRLVTSSYHMPRSVSEFREAMPGIIIVPDPSFSGDFSLQYWWLDTENRALVLSEFHKFIAGQLRHVLISTRH